VPHLAVETVPVVLSPGETLLLYTDGVTEARDPSGVELGETTLAMLLAGRHGRCVEDVAGELAFEVLKLVDGDLRDDLALLALTR
jgi:serine phosphatase RsbU (regulator of sigma subunit)